MAGLNSKPGIGFPGGKYFVDGVVHSSHSVDGFGVIPPREEFQGALPEPLIEVASYHDDLPSVVKSDREFMDYIELVCSARISDDNKVSCVINFVFDHLRRFYYSTPNLIEKCQTQQAP